MQKQTQGHTFLTLKIYSRRRVLFSILIEPNPAC
jgi:hypothetical protein